MEDARSRATMDMSTLQGTLRFVSPETMTRGTVSKQTDVYSYGMTVYQVALLLSTAWIALNFP